jgi:CheY-like chemotaxis protein
MNRDVIVLLAEDDPGHALLVERVLRRAGVGNQFLHFSDGQEILDFLITASAASDFQDRTFVVLLDIRMPGLDGTEVLRHIRADERLRRLPVVMLSSTDDPEEIQRCRELGCDGYLVKPLSAERVLDTVRKLGLFLSIVESEPSIGE